MPPFLTTKSRVRGCVKRDLGQLEVSWDQISPPDSGNYLSPPVRTQSIDWGIYESLTSTGHKGPPYHEGGPFLVRRYTINYGLRAGSFDLTQKTSDGNTTYRNVFTGLQSMDQSLVPYLGIPSIQTEQDLKAAYDNISLQSIDLNSYGATAVSRFSPLKPGANAAQALLEGFHDGLPALNLLKNSKRAVENFLDGSGNGGLLSAGSKDFLNVEFGWLPLLNDLRQVYHTWQSLDSKMRQLVRDNGRPVRRSGKLHSSVDVTEQVHNWGSVLTPPLSQLQASYPPDYTNVRKIVQTTRISEDIWFKGRFRYYLPWDPLKESFPLKAKLALFGLTNPVALYQAYPWSWLLDWFTNVGDVLNNLSSNGLGELIIDYGYVMRHAQKLDTWTVYPTFSHVGSLGPGCEQVEIRSNAQPLVITSLEEHKERVAATPFGFGLQLTDLSARQLAILTALGLSRSNF